MSEYFSEAELGPEPADLSDISELFWRGFVGAINSYISANFFTARFPYCCSESSDPVECDWRSLSAVFQAEIASISWPLDYGEVPQTPSCLDAVQFFARIASKPERTRYHDYMRHSHILPFDREAGYSDYCETMNRLLRRCRHPYQLAADYSGRIERLVPVGLDELARSRFRTGDAELDAMLESALEKIRRPDPGVRGEALEKLWDAWERMKTILSPDKKLGVAQLLERAFPEPQLRGRVEDEAKALTAIGNDFMIRHSEMTKTPVAPEHVDYLFYRLLTLVHALVRAL